jgi:hypothetical protein
MFASRSESERDSSQASECLRPENFLLKEALVWCNKFKDG